MSLTYISNSIENPSFLAGGKISRLSDAQALTNRQNVKGKVASESLPTARPLFNPNSTKHLTNILRGQVKDPTLRNNDRDVVDKDPHILIIR